MKRTVFYLLISLLSFSSLGCRNWDKLSDQDRATLDRVLAHWETWVPARKKDATAPLMTFRELYQGLGTREQDFLNRVRQIKPSDAEFDSTISFKKIDGQTIFKKGKPETSEKIDAQYLPQNVYDAYEKLMAAMKQDLGKRLWVESGYRSPAYQLYTFLYYTPKHHYSLKETRQWVALPGHSEHGNPKDQAIDFINEEGIDGDSDHQQTAADFEVLPEYQWLQRRAKEFGFELSYPRGSKNTTFEPWHWRYYKK